MTIFNRSAVARYFDVIRTRRVDFIDIGDSNEYFNGHGRNHQTQVGYEQVMLLAMTDLILWS